MKKILSCIMLSILVISLMAINVSAETKPLRLVDEADLLSESEETKILSRLDELSETYKYDIVILTQKSIGKKSERAFADDYYDNNGYGFGEDFTGLLLLITFDEEGGIWYISTCGEAINAFTDSTIDKIGSLISDDLASEDYSSAFDTFLDECDYYINGYINGFPFNASRNIIISIAIGLVIALIVVSSMKQKLKTVELQRDATTYVKQGSMQVNVERDFFLYSTITRVAKPKNNGSSTHTSSSGRSHGGGGGRF